MNNKENVKAFIERWRGVTASELATAQTFVMNSCDLLDVEKPHAAADQECMFERPVDFRHGDGSTSPGRIDCYKRGRWVTGCPQFWRHGKPSAAPATQWSLNDGKRPET